MVLVGGDLIVHERVVVAHVPKGGHYVALNPRRPGRRRRHFTRGNAFGPARKYLERRILCPA